MNISPLATQSQILFSVGTSLKYTSSNGRFLFSAGDGECQLWDFMADTAAFRYPRSPQVFNAVVSSEGCVAIETVHELLILSNSGSILLKTERGSDLKACSAGFCWRKDAETVSLFYLENLLRIDISIPPASFEVHALYFDENYFIQVGSFDIAVYDHRMRAHYEKRYCDRSPANKSLALHGELLVIAGFQTLRPNPIKVRGFEILVFHLPTGEVTIRKELDNFRPHRFAVDFHSDWAIFRIFQTYTALLRFSLSTGETQTLSWNQSVHRPSFHENWMLSSSVNMRGERELTLSEIATKRVVSRILLDPKAAGEPSLCNERVFIPVPDMNQVLTVTLSDLQATRKSPGR